MDSDVTLMAAWRFSSNMTPVHKTSMEAKYSEGTAPSSVFLNAAGTQHQHLMVSAWGRKTCPGLCLVPARPLLQACTSSDSTRPSAVGQGEMDKKFLGCRDIFTPFINDLGFLSHSWGERRFSLPLYLVNFLPLLAFPSGDVTTLLEQQFLTPARAMGTAGPPSETGEPERKHGWRVSFNFFILQCTHPNSADGTWWNPPSATTRSEHFHLRAGSSSKALQCVLHSYKLSMKNIYIGFRLALYVTG